MLLTQKNITKIFAIAIPIFVIKGIDTPVAHLLNSVLDEPSFEVARFIVITSSLFTLVVGVISILICIKIWNRSNRITEQSHE